MEPPDVDAFEILENVNVKVGTCSIEKLMGILNPCMRKFYMKYREDPNIDCMTNFNSMRSCVENEVKQCFTGTDADDETIASVSQAIVMESLPEEDATKFCERSGIEPPVEPGSDQVVYCSKDYYNESEILTNEFNTLFAKDRGNPSLCRLYEEFGKNFLELTKAKCRPSFYRFVQKQMRWAESKSLNPFCSEDQIKENS